jgi:hypothetical protein
MLAEAILLRNAARSICIKAYFRYCHLLAKKYGREEADALVGDGGSGT